MNINTLKALGIFAVGVCIGAFSTHYYLKKQVENMIQEEIESIREYQKKRKEKGRWKNTGEVDEIPLTTEPEREKVLVHFPSNIQKVVKHYGGSNNPDLEELSAKANEPNKKEPYCISVEQYSDEMDHFDKLTIYFYQKDNTLIDENEEIIVDVESVIGETLKDFGNLSDDPDVVYVRNEKIAIDYEVIRLYKSYAETTGINEG